MMLVEGEKRLDRETREIKRKPRKVGFAAFVPFRGFRDPMFFVFRYLRMIKSFSYRPFLRWLPALVWMGLIFYLSSQSTLPLLPQDHGLFEFVSRKGGHLLEYAILALLLGYALGCIRHGALVALLLASLYGASDEVHQYFVAGREARVFDWGVDTLGATLGAWAMIWIQRRQGGGEG
jgi:VanZ family protein